MNRQLNHILTNLIAIDSEIKIKKNAFTWKIGHPCYRLLLSWFLSFSHYPRYTLMPSRHTSMETAKRQRIIKTYFLMENSRAMMVLCVSKLSCSVLNCTFVHMFQTNLKFTFRSSCFWEKVYKGIDWKHHTFETNWLLW